MFTQNTRLSTRLSACHDGQKKSCQQAFHRACRHEKPTGSVTNLMIFRRDRSLHEFLANACISMFLTVIAACGARAQFFHTQPFSSGRNLEKRKESRQSGGKNEIENQGSVERWINQFDWFRIARERKNRPNMPSVYVLRQNSCRPIGISLLWAVVTEIGMKYFADAAARKAGSVGVPIRAAPLRRLPTSERSS